MTFNLGAILVFTIFALLYGGLFPAKLRAWALLIGSVLAVYWLQPALPIRFSDYIFPTLTIGLTVTTWWITRRPAEEAQREKNREDWKVLILVAGLVIGMAFFRYVDQDLRLTASRPPPPLIVFLVLCISGIGLAIAIRLFQRNRSSDLNTGDRLLTFTIILLVILFVIVKTEYLSSHLSRLWRSASGQDTSLASMLDLSWIGFSFVAFRLIHTLRDRQQGILPILSLREYISYIIFFPAYTAGPIDRAERFVQDYRAVPNINGMESTRWANGLTRITLGLMKKFIIADTLARGLSLNVSNVYQADSPFALWLLLYGFSFRLYFDFAGYSDIAIGIGILFGIKLPENFNFPYFKTNITAFWQSWHITLSNWVRFYIFTPLSRWLLRRSWKPTTTVTVFIAQVTTMVVMGLWHGITVNFFIWGVWHGVGLFIHKVWSDRSRKWYRELKEKPKQKKAWTFFSWFLTFNYVVLGWVWFAMPTLNDSWLLMTGLFGFG